MKYIVLSLQLKHKISVKAPPKLLVERYLIEIAKSHNVPYEPDPSVLNVSRFKGSKSLLQTQPFQVLWIQ